MSQGVADRFDSSGRWARHAAGGLLLVLAVVLPLLRQRGVPSWRSIWGEDGKIYFQQAHDHGAFGALFRGYAGYLQFPPRIVGAFSTLVPVRSLPLYFAVAATLVCALLAWFLYWATCGVIESRAVRLCLAGLVVLLPQMGWEGTANSTNTTWSFLAVTPWALLSLRDRHRDVVIRCVVLFFAATATLLAAAFLPVAALQALRHRSRRALAVPVAFCCGLAVQAAVVTHTPRLFGDSLHRSVPRLVDLLDARVFAEVLIGDKGVASLWNAHGRLVVTVAPLLVIALLAVLLRGAPRERRITACFFAAFAVLVYIFPVWSRGTNQIITSAAEISVKRANRTLGTISTFGGPGGSYRSDGLRYSVVPVFFLTSAYGVLVDSHRAAAGAFRRGAVLLFVAWVVALTAIGFPVTNRRSPGPDWSTEVRRVYGQACIGVPSSTRVEVPNAPYDPSYVVRLTCGELRP